MREPEKIAVNLENMHFEFIKYLIIAKHEFPNSDQSLQLFLNPPKELLDPDLDSAKGEQMFK